MSLADKVEIIRDESSDFNAKEIAAKAMASLGIDKATSGVSHHDVRMAAELAAQSAYKQALMGPAADQLSLLEGGES